MCRARVVVAVVLVCSAAVHAGGAYADSEQRYQGARLGFLLPAGWKVKDVADVAAEYAVEVVVPVGSPAAGAHLRLLVASGKTSDADVEASANALRDARLKNRASWGVHTKGDRRAEIGRVGSHRSVRLVDQMGSVLGASQQVMQCAAYGSRLVCAVSDGPPDAQRAGEAVLAHALETLSLAK